MIVVTGWRRSGTSMLMKTLAAGGMTALVEPEYTEPRPPVSPSGTWELVGVYTDPVETLGPVINEPDVCVKAIFKPMAALLDAGLRPAAVLVTVRNVTESLESLRWLLERRMLLDAVPVPTPEEYLEEHEQVRKRLDSLSIPFAQVDFDEMMDSTLSTTRAIAEFLRPFVSVSLDVDNMATVPDRAIASQR